MDILGKAGRWADFLRQDALSALPDGGSPARPYTRLKILKLLIPLATWRKQFDVMHSSDLGPRPPQYLFISDIMFLLSMFIVYYIFTAVYRYSTILVYPKPDPRQVRNTTVIWIGACSQVEGLRRIQWKFPQPSQLKLALTVLAFIS